MMAGCVVASFAPLGDVWAILNRWEGLLRGVLIAWICSDMIYGRSLWYLGNCGCVFGRERRVAISEIRQVRPSYSSRSVY
jgi:hypothetical protein